jgi:hypothetical protein
MGAAVLAPRLTQLMKHTLFVRGNGELAAPLSRALLTPLPAGAASLEGAASGFDVALLAGVVGVLLPCAAGGA